MARAGCSAGLHPKGMRGAYTERGVDRWYAENGASYINPHDREVAKALHWLLELWHMQFYERKIEGVSSGPSAELLSLPPFRILDLACGSGEATVAIQNWWGTCARRAEQAGRACPLLISLPLSIEGCDPYTFEAYLQRTGQQALQLTFQQVAQGALEMDVEGPASCQAQAQGWVPANCVVYDLVVISFALHLVNPSMVWSTLDALSRVSHWLVLISPHKKPIVKDDGSFKWRLVQEGCIERVHIRLFEVQA